MVALNDREKVFGDKFQYDEEIRFRVEAWQVRLTGVWAAERMGMIGDDVADYATSLVKLSLGEPGLQDVITRLVADFNDKGFTLSQHRIEREMENFLAQAKERIMSE